jgi:hypothetical protein
MGTSSVDFQDHCLSIAGSWAVWTLRGPVVSLHPIERRAHSFAASCDAAKFKLVLPYCGAARMSVLDNIGREVQEEDLLCWAAVSTMAVRAFPEDAAFKHPTQREIVIYQRAGINSVAKLGSALGNPNSALGKKLTSAQGTCSVLGMCNAPNVDGLHLYDLASKKVGAGKVLLPEHFEIEIDDRGCPVPIRWTYEGRKLTHGRLRTGEHALIVTGYRWETHELRVWDPWPSLLNPDPSPGPHEKWIPYDTYVDPQNDEGLDALALHEFDQYKLRRRGRNISGPDRLPAARNTDGRPGAPPGAAGLRGRDRRPARSGRDVPARPRGAQFFR